MGFFIGVIAGVVCISALMKIKTILNYKEICIKCGNKSFDNTLNKCVLCGLNKNIQDDNISKEEMDVRKDSLGIFAKIHDYSNSINNLIKKLEGLTIVKKDYNYATREFKIEMLDFNTIFENVQNEFELEKVYNKIIIILNDLSCSAKLLWACSSNIESGKLQSKLFNKHLKETFDLLASMHKNALMCCDFFEIIKDIKDNKILIEKICKNIISSVGDIEKLTEKLNDHVVFTSNINNYSEEQIKENTEKLNKLTISLKIYKDLEGNVKEEEFKEKQREYMEEKD